MLLFRVVFSFFKLEAFAFSREAAPSGVAALMAHASAFRENHGRVQPDFARFGVFTWSH
jgi:hypothetical protein